MDAAAYLGIALLSLVVAILVKNLLVKRYLDPEAERLARIEAERERESRAAGSEGRARAIAAKVGNAMPLARKDETAYRARLARAGVKMDAGTWRGVELLALAACAGLGLVLGLTFSDAIATLGCAGIGALAGIGLPRLFLSATEKQRRAQIDSSLPDVLDLLAISVEAGSTLERGFKQIAQKCSGPIAEEFAQVDRDINMFNISSVDALGRMSERCRSRQLGIFCSSLAQSLVQGASIGPALKEQAASARRAEFDALEEKANKLAVKAVLPMSIFFLPATLIMGVAPFVAQLATTAMSLTGAM
jgi:tight adherence protein C